MLGPPGSGVEWLRLMVEQMTGLYTGSVMHKHQDIFEGEGKLKDVSIQENKYATKFITNYLIIL